MAKEARKSRGGSKPGERRGGRKPGTPNKLTAEAKAAIEATFEAMGGVPALTKWASANPEAFYTKVYTKIVRKEVDHTTQGRRIFVPGSELPDFSPSAPQE